MTRRTVVVSKRASPKGVTHTCVSFHDARCIRGDLPNKPVDTQRGSFEIDVSRPRVRCEVPVTGEDGRRRGGRRSQPGGCSGSSVWWSGSPAAPSVTRGTDKLQCWVVGALSSHSPQGAEVPLILVSRWSPYPTVETWGFGDSRPLAKAFLLYPIISGFFVFFCGVVNLHPMVFSPLIF